MFQDSVGLSLCIVIRSPANNKHQSNERNITKSKIIDNRNCRRPVGTCKLAGGDKHVFSELGFGISKFKDFKVFLDPIIIVHNGRHCEKGMISWLTVYRHSWYITLLCRY